MKFPKSSIAANDHSTTHDNFIGQIAAMIGITVQHVIAPDVRFVDSKLYMVYICLNLLSWCVFLPDCGFIMILCYTYIINLCNSMLWIQV